MKRNWKEIEREPDKYKKESKSSLLNESIKGTHMLSIYKLYKFSPIITRRLESYSNCVDILM